MEVEPEERVPNRGAPSTVNNGIARPRAQRAALGRLVLQSTVLRIGEVGSGEVENT